MAVDFEKGLKMIHRSAIVCALVVAALTSVYTPEARSQSSSGRYVTRETVRHCQDEELNTGIGVAAGAAFGAGMGFLLGNRDVGATVVGGVAGGIAGGLLGNGFSCEDEVRYIDRVEHHIARRDYRQSPVFQEDGFQCEIVRSGYGRGGRSCRTYVSDVRLRTGEWIRKVETACYSQGSWRHGFADDEIVDIRWERPYRPSRRELRREFRERRPYHHTYDQEPRYYPYGY